MDTFYFHLRAGTKLIRDEDGTTCRSLAEARNHACKVASELMTNAQSKTRHWSLGICDGDDQFLFEVFFADVDETLACFTPEMRQLVRQTCRRHSAWIAVAEAARATIRESRALLARSDGRLYLAADNGRLI
jgi:hypothetical protein